MKYKIVYDRPGRLRVRCGADVFTAEEGYGIAELLRKNAAATDVEVCPVNGSILVYYPDNNKEAVLSLLRGLKRCSLPVGKPTEEDKKREIDTDFTRKAVSLVDGHFAKKLLPAPIRLIFTLHNAIEFWSEGIRSLSQLRLDVPVLDAASVGAAFAQRDVNTAGSIMFLLRLSELLEDYTRKRTTSVLT